MNKCISLALVTMLTMTACSLRSIPTDGKDNPNMGKELTPIECNLTYLPEVTELVEIPDELPLFANDYDNLIYEAVKDTDVDPYLAIAISRLETGHYTSRAFVEGHNFGGITFSSGVASFDSLSDGLDRYVMLLEWYNRNGMTTAELMQSTYCPPNEGWDVVVNEIYESMVSEVN